MSALLGNKSPVAVQDTATTQPRQEPASDIRREIMAEITGAVRNAGTPLPLEALAERATRALGHERTVGTDWGGAGSFRELLLQSLPEGIRLSEQPPYVVYDSTRRQAAVEAAASPARPERTQRPASLMAPRPASASPATSAAAAALTQALEPIAATRTTHAQPQSAHQVYRTAAGLAASHSRESSVEISQPATQRVAAPPAAPAAAAPPARSAEGATALQQSIARIHEACQAPPLSPPEYRALFELLALEINDAGLQGAQTITNVANRAREIGLDIRRDDIRFALDVVGEADPWFEQGASANLFAGRFRNFVVARCRSHGLNLTSDEIDLIDAWFTGAGSPPMSPRQAASSSSQALTRTTSQPAPSAASEPRAERWWNADSTADAQAATPRRTAVTAGEPQQPTQAAYASEPADFGHGDEFPRIVRTRLRG